jgi:ABC-type polysaccharide/polyol phosphate export permease
MVTDDVKQKSVPWANRPMAAAVFCAILCAGTIVISLLSSMNQTNSSAQIILLLGFLPTCFVFVGLAISNMKTEIRNLREQVETLSKASMSPDGARGL